MFNTNEMDHRRDDYISHRMQLAARDNLAKIARPEQPAFGQRVLARITRLWQQRPDFNTRKPLVDHAASATRATGTLGNVG